MENGLQENQSYQLKRALGFWAITAYGVGDILGAGIYALMGKVAGLAGHVSWIAFSVSMVVAAFTALTYSELVGRYPYSGGESYYVVKGFKRESLALITGWLVFCAGTLSLSAIGLAFAGYIQGFYPRINTALLLTGFLLVLGFINYRGIKESSAINIICTVIEFSGLIIVVAAGIIMISGDTAPVKNITPSVTVREISWIAVMQGAALAFFAFIGFQDMVNVAEEVKEPQKNFPAAILTALGLAGVIYIFIAFIAVKAVPPETLAASKAPLLEVVRASKMPVPDGLFTLIALFAVANTGLLNFIMASRLLYGMANQGLLPSWLGTIDRKRQTPRNAIMTVLSVSFLLAVTGTIAYLAGTTSLLLLIVFFAVNASLVLIKGRPIPEKKGFTVPLWIPVIGAITSLALIFFVDTSSLLSAMVLLAVGSAIVIVKKGSIPNIEKR